MANGNFKILAMFSFIAAATFLIWRYDTDRTNAVMKERETTLLHDVDAELPNGTPRADVTHFLTTRHLDNLHIDVGESNPMYGGASSVTYATTDVMGNALQGCSTMLTFRFTTADTLMNHSYATHCKSRF
jgi:hypothetical protein